MKSKEEIEQLAKQLCNIPIDLVIDEEERYYKNFQKYDGIIQGYTQCQEDMAKRITDLENILHTICTWCNPHDSSHENIWRIANNSLNKQD